MTAKKPAITRVEAIRCPTCGAAPGEKCERNSGQVRGEPHSDRRLIAGRLGRATLFPPTGAQGINAWLH